MKIIKAMLAGKPPVSVKRLLHRAMAGYRPQRSQKIVHASDLTKVGEDEWCPRQFALMDITKMKPKPEFLSTSMCHTYDHGRAMQARLNNVYLREFMIGDWRCSSCGNVKAHCRAPKGSCGLSGISCVWEFAEPRVRDPASKISGGLDGFLYVQEQKSRLIEVKTMVKEKFDKLEAPLWEHTLRTQLYLRLIEWDLAPWTETVNTDRAHIVYFSKSHGPKSEEVATYGFKDAPFSPFKEFEIHAPMEGSDQDNMIRSIRSRALALAKYRKDKKLMPCGICENAFVKRAQYCPAAKECWGGKFPGMTTWVTPNGQLHAPGKMMVVVKNGNDT